MKSKKINALKTSNKKIEDLSMDVSDGTDKFLTTNQGVKINDDQNSLKSGERGATLLEDFILREKITHFDHERIPERIVHARGAAAHGVFELYKPMTSYTKASFLQVSGSITPVFVRFSTVAGSRGSTDLARDVRGFAVKFYTEEGIYDLVGNNMPVFFIQDAVKFPDLIHAVKPEQHNEIPQAASAHDTFWDFISLMPESMHMIMWVMSDRAIPRSFRMIEGFGIHTFRFINDIGKTCFVKFHWKPLLGVHSVVWDEAQKISGYDPDFHRRDLWEAIESGNYPEWELGVQIINEEDENRFEFDLLDPTKLIPEEIVPVQIIGKMTLNRNPDNFFAETEQVAFHPGHIVPGIDFTNDPLLQGRLFSYTDTQLSRLGSPNFHEIPINRSVSPTYNNQRDGHMRQTINTGKSSYSPNTLGGGCPFQAKLAQGGFNSFAERIDSKKIRARSRSFFDHFGQATLFYKSQSDAEKKHLANALCFELGKVENAGVKERMLLLLSNVDDQLAETVADSLGMAVPKNQDQQLNFSIPADVEPSTLQPTQPKSSIEVSGALSMANTIKTIKTRKIAVLVSNSTKDTAFVKVKSALEKAGAMVKIIAPKFGFIGPEKDLKIDHSIKTVSSVLFDAVYLPGGAENFNALLGNVFVENFIKDAFIHCKPIAGEAEGKDLFIQAVGAGYETSEGVLFNSTPEEVVNLMAQHRYWNREEVLS